MFDINSAHPDDVISTGIDISWPSDNVTAVLGLRTVAVARVAVAALVTVAVRETPAGIALFRISP
jgi:hypothetical protein